MVRSKREYLLRLTQQSPDWLRASMAEPTHYMTRIACASACGGAAAHAGFDAQR